MSLRRRDQIDEQWEAAWTSRETPPFTRQAHAVARRRDDEIAFEKAHVREDVQWEWGRRRYT